MDAKQLSKTKWRLEFAGNDFELLHRHLFPGDNDEHGAVLAAGISHGTDGVTRLLVRDVRLAEDGVDFIESERGYRKLRAQFVRDNVRKCIDEGLVYLAVHNHGGQDSVAFSHTDFASHERGYPALLDLANGLPVGALVFAKNAAAGDIWLPGGNRVPLDRTTVIGARRVLMWPAPQRGAWPVSDLAYDRQARLLGDRGQSALRDATVAVVGLGGVRSLIAEYLGHLGVGTIVLIDPDRLDWTNLSRVVGSRRIDAFPRLSPDTKLPRWLVGALQKLRTFKVNIARRNVLRANPKAKVQALTVDMCDPSAVEKLIGCDYLFLAADSMRARLLFNAIVQQHYIPGVQVGSKVQVNPNGDVGNVFSIIRPVSPGEGCLWCNQVVNPAKLQEEAASPEVRQAQGYGVGEDAPAPSVITLNAVGASQAVNDFLFYITGLTSSKASQDYVRVEARDRKTVQMRPRKDESCTECSKRSWSRLARGDATALPGVVPSRTR